MTAPLTLDGTFSVHIVDWALEEERLMTVRLEVFVVEQNVPLELELDGIDGDCLHALALDGADEPVGCGRLLPDGRIGRMAVRAPWRQRGVGAAILEHLIELAGERGHRRIVLNAQTHAVGFYRRFGFTEFGDEYDDAGIPHRAMERVLPASYSANAG